MAIAIEDVPSWCVFMGIGHAIARVDSRMIMTVCSSVIFGDQTQTQRPKRICGECRAKLAEETTRLLSVREKHQLRRSRQTQP